LYDCTDMTLLVELAQFEARTVLAEASWMDKYDRRSLTKDESAKLKVPKEKLSCSVMYFEPKRKGTKGGYMAYTHRASSGFFDKPEDIPEKKLLFISSTS
jgi:hypothetical protein